jgi:hypothetical protein
MLHGEQADVKPILRTIYNRAHMERGRACLVQARDGGARAYIFFASAPFLTQEAGGSVTCAGIDCPGVAARGRPVGLHVLGRSSTCRERIGRRARLKVSTQGRGVPSIPSDNLPVSIGPAWLCWVGLFCIRISRLSPGLRTEWGGQYWDLCPLAVQAGGKTESSRESDPQATLACGCPPVLTGSLWST